MIGVDVGSMSGRHLQAKPGANPYNAACGRLQRTNGKHSNIMPGVHRQRSAITFRSILLGALACALINVGEPYLVGYIHTSPLSADFSTGAAVFLFFVLTMMINLPLRKVCPDFALSASELLVCYIMMIIACAVPSWGFTMLLIPWIVAPTYYATPENQWDQIIIPKLKEDYFVLDTEAARMFFDGLGEGERIPWQVWVEPLTNWAIFILCFYIACVSMMVLLRRQWVLHERLSYPLAQLPLALVDREGRGGPPVYRRVAFWIGVAVPALVYTLKGLNAYFPDVPVMPQGTSIYINEFRMRLAMGFYFEVIGLAFLLSSDMAFSLWLFALLSFIEQGIFYNVGFTIGPMQPYSQPGAQEISNQALGAMVVLVVIGMWRARKHLWHTIASALGIENSDAQNEEIASYRMAWLGLTVAGAYVMYWWASTGLGANALVLSFWMGILFIGLSRAVVQGGMAYARSPVVPAVATLHSVGTSNLGAQGAIGLAMTAPYAMDTRTTVMTSMANGLRLTEEIPGSRRRMAFAVIVALVVSLFAAFVTVLVLPYVYGCLNLSGWGFSSGYHHYIYNWARNQIAHDVPVGTSQFGFMGLGGAAMLGLMWLQKSFYWWPIHPLGLALGYTHPVCFTWFSVFLAWLAKVLVTWAGGGTAFRQVRPFFIGLAVGGFTTAGFWALVHAIVGYGAVSFTLG